MPSITPSSKLKAVGMLLTAAQLIQTANAQESSSNSMAHDLFSNPVIAGTLLVAVPGVIVTVCALTYICIESTCKKISSQKESAIEDNNAKNDGVVKRNSSMLFSWCNRGKDDKDLEASVPMMSMMNH